jgi:hypothetical protein
VVIKSRKNKFLAKLASRTIYMIPSIFWGQLFSDSFTAYFWYQNCNHMTSSVFPPNKKKEINFLPLAVMVETQTKELIEVKTLETEERQTIVHCRCNGDYAYRVWPSTFLIEHDTGKKAKLITAYNISFAPQWTLNDGKGFTLIFEGLSKNCKIFDLKEIIPQEGGFEVVSIRRNKTDVYQVKI